MIQFAPIASGPGEVERGLELLWRSPPLWPIEPRQWRMLIEVVRSLDQTWREAAQACGWTQLELFGLHSVAPGARRDGMGAFFVVARAGDRVIDVTASAVHLEAFTGARSRVPRTDPGPRAVLAWRLAELRSAPGVR